MASAFPEFGVAAAFTFGFIGSLSHCPGMCGGFAAGVALPGRQGSSPLARSIAYHVGRLFTYSLIGALVGFTGSLVNAFGNFSELLRSGATILGGTFMLLTGVTLLAGNVAWMERFIPTGGIVKKAAPLLRRDSWQSSLQLGVLLGFLPCGLIYSAASYALTEGSALRGAATLFAFGLGTVPALAATALLASWLRRYGKAFRLVAGLILIGSSIRYLWLGFPG